MSNLEKILEDMENAPQNVSFSDLSKICAHYFGEPRSKGTSHHVYKTPWEGDPRVNIQKGKMARQSPIRLNRFWRLYGG